MCLVEHDDRVLAHIRINETLSLEHTVRHVLDLRLGARTVFETDRIADFLSQPTPHFLGHTLRDGHGGDTTGLGAAYLATVGETSFGEVLCHLGGLA